MRDADFERYAALTDKLNEVGEVPCRENPDLFYPEDQFDENNKRIVTERAKALCQNCPAIYLCAEYAVKAREAFGIWGGLTYKERKSLMGRF